MLHRWFHLNLDAIATPLERRQAPLLQRMLVSLICLALVGALVTIFLPSNVLSKVIVLAVVGIMVCVLLLALHWLRQGHVRRAAVISAMTTVVSFTISTLIPHGLRSGTAGVIFFAVPITIAGLMAGRRWLMATAGLILASMLSVAAVERAMPELVGFVETGGDQTASLISGTLLIVGVLVILLDQFGGSLRRALGEAAANQQAAELAQAEAEAHAHTLHDKTQQLERTEQYLRELVTTSEAPAVTLADGILLTPIVGALDSQRVQALTTRLLTQVSTQRARRIVIDLAGVPVVDTGVAQALQRMATALRLLGCDVTLTGISAAVAQTVAHLGLVFEGVTIARSPRDVLGMQTV